MGGGFYDRSFAFKLRKNSTKRPLMIGLAHSFQETESAFNDPWDVPLDAIITDRELIII
jgi:5-formyltetrahydrofolate cyclo-ligase